MKIKYNCIDSKLFSSIISYNQQEVINNESDFRKENSDFYSKRSDDSYIFDIESYVKRIRTLFKDKGLSSNIEITTLKQPQSIEENNSEYLFKYKIIIKNLRVKCKSEIYAFDSLPIIDEYLNEGYKISSERYKGGILIYFENINFNSIEKYNSYINIGLNNECRLIFSNCNFNGVDLFCKVSDDASIYFDTNKFENRHITISGAVGYDNISGFGKENNHVKIENLSKIYASRRLNSFIRKTREDKEFHYKEKLLEKVNKNEELDTNDLIKYLLDRDLTLNIKPSDVEYRYNDNSIITFRNNIISKIQIGGEKFYFIGVNKIKKISGASKPYTIYWGPYNELDKEGKNARNHKPIIISWKEHALKGKDNSQELILNRELMKIERHILKYEKTNKSWKDRFILWFNGFSNDYGTNWFKPIGLILLINLLFTSTILFNFGYVLTSFSLDNLFNNLGIYFEFLLPTNSVKNVMNEDVFNKGWEALNIIKNIFLSIFFYQTIVAFRKYSNK